MSEQQQNEAARAELNGQGMETFEAMTAKMQDLTAYNKQISEEAGAQSEATYATARALVLGLIVVATVLAALVARLHHPQHARPVGQRPRRTGRAGQNRWRAAGWNWMRTLMPEACTRKY